MRTDYECLDCFRSQVLKTVRLVSDDPDVERRVVQEAEALLSQLERSLSPPENAVAVYGLIAGITGVDDPYGSLRAMSNSMALDLRDEVRRRIEESDDPLKTAVRYAVAANVIDYGVLHDFDVMSSLTDCLGKDFAIDDTGVLAEELGGTRRPSILYLADNSGEIVFDGLLVEQLQKYGCEVILAVRKTRILNDVTFADAVFCGIDKICRVIDNGTGCPGTPLSACSDTFRSVFERSDIIISKGQGNFETLSEAGAPIYFLLTVKCPVVGRHIREIRGFHAKLPVGGGEMIVMKRNR